MFQMALTDRADGTAVTNTGDDLMVMLARADVLARGGHVELRKQAGELLRDAAERFCKEMLVKDRWTKGDKGAALSDYDGKNLGQLEPKVEPLLRADPSHPGKLRSIGSQLNPAKHDDDTPDQRGRPGRFAGPQGVGSAIQAERGAARGVGRDCGERSGPGDPRRGAVR